MLPFPVYLRTKDSVVRLRWGKTPHNIDISKNRFKRSHPLFFVGGERQTTVPTNQLSLQL